MAADTNVLIGAVRWLCLTSVGAREDVESAAALVVAALLDLAAYQHGEDDPRRQRTLELAERIKRAKAAGVPVAELAERFRLSKRSVYRLLSVTTSRHTSAVHSSARTRGVKRNA